MLFFYKEYRRHQSDVFNAAIKMLGELIQQVGDIDVNVVITGSGGLGMAQVMDAKFEQEVIACTKTIEEIIPQTDVAIELGGEDAKLTFPDRQSWTASTCCCQLLPSS